MSVQQLHNTLRDLPRFGQLVKDRGYRQVWRFEHDGKAYYLKLYPRAGTRLKRMLRGNPAMREFLRLQWLQKADVPAPRAVAVLMGMRVNDVVGDAVLLEALEPSITLGQHLTEYALRAEPVPNHLDLSRRVRGLVERLGNAKLGHGDLHVDNFLLHHGRVYLLDAYAVRRGGLKLRDVMMLGHSVRRFATTTDLLRAWQLFQGDDPMPRHNPVSPALYRKFIERVMGDNEFFGRLHHDGWSGACFKKAKFSRRSSPASQMSFTQADWDQAFPRLLEQVMADQFTIHKRSASGDVLSGEIVLGGKPLNVFIKRPRRKYFYRYLTSIGPFTRVRRMWLKAWKLSVRDIPTEWPLLMVEKRTLGYMTDGLIVFEHVPGHTLADSDLDAMQPNARQMLFHRIGRILRLIDQHGFAYFDSKATNWIVQADEKRGPTPVIIDVDGIRHYRSPGSGIRRLLRSMREHAQYTPADSYAICKGYLPYGRLDIEDAADEDDAEEPRA